MHPLSRRRALALGFALLTLLPACAADTQEDAQVAVASNDGDHPLCALQSEFDQTRWATPDEEPDATEEQADQAGKDYAAGVLAVLERQATESPEELSDAVATQQQAWAEMAETGQPVPFQSEEVGEARQVMERWVREHCDVRQLDVVGVDYAFGGLPDTLTAGRHSIALDNQGEEYHVLGIYRPHNEEDAGDKAAAEALLDSYYQSETRDGAAWSQKVDDVGGAETPPGAQALTTVDLAPGRYILYCPVPVGEEGEPHYKHGMLEIVTVHE